MYKAAQGRKRPPRRHIMVVVTLLLPFINPFHTEAHQRVRPTSLCSSETYPFLKLPLLPAAPSI